MGVVRAFAAVPVPVEITRRMAGVIANARRDCSGVKWVDPANMHITLKFFGDVPVSRVDDLTAVLVAAAAEHRVFEVGVQGVGAFPSADRPRVFWAGIGQGGDALISLAGSVERATTEAGFPPSDRPFSPHLTLGRVRSDAQVHGLPEGLSVCVGKPWGNISADGITLYSSVLRPAGPIYTVIGYAPLLP